MASRTRKIAFRALIKMVIMQGPSILHVSADRVSGSEGARVVGFLTPVFIAVAISRTNLLSRKQSIFLKLFDHSTFHCPPP